MKIKSNVNADSFFEYDNDVTCLAAGVMSVTVHNTAGIFLNGPVSIPGPFTNIRFETMFKFNSMLALGLPSTLITPISTFEVDVPVKEAGTQIALMSMIMSTVAG